MSTQVVAGLTPECVRTIVVPELARAGWLQKPLLNAQLFAQVAGIARRTFYQYRSADKGIPAPLVKNVHGERWSFAQAYSFVAEYRPKRGPNIPRLVPLGDLGPAQFVAAEAGYAKPPMKPHATERKMVEHLTVSCNLRTITHYWRPADHRGQIAVAYLPHVVGGVVDTAWASAIAVSLIDQMQQYVSAVIVPTTMRTDEGFDLRVVVAEPVSNSSSGVVLPVFPWLAGESQHGGPLYEICYSDLAALLRVELPEWGPSELSESSLLSFDPHRQHIADPARFVPAPNAYLGTPRSSTTQRPMGYWYASGTPSNAPISNTCSTKTQAGNPDRS
ncbi:hypothetical protein MASS_2p0024 (plasmid) [Mycobacteroides abscessus subsp. bolletii 50594]|uniref:Uncharacterized protein n=3 Tax=Mycobacteroides abscessus TaxID=36809 RepID=A0AB33AIG6_9MYCO|nr:hypothetical protein MASS_2p0024 [Mycobacteroides abscessus subsp. bolletii 50594]